MICFSQRNSLYTRVSVDLVNKSTLDLLVMILLIHRSKFWNQWLFLLFLVIFNFQPYKLVTHVWLEFESLLSLARWELHMDTACCSGQIPDKTPYKTAVVRPLTPHLTNHPRKASGTCRELLQKLVTFYFELLHMNTPVLADQQKDIHHFCKDTWCHLDDISRTLASIDVDREIKRWIDRERERKREILILSYLLQVNFLSKIYNLSNLIKNKSMLLLKI